LRVGIVTEWFSRGAAYVSQQYRRALADQGVEVFIYARGDRDPRASDEWRDERTHTAVACRVRRPKAIYAPDFERWLLRNKIDCVLFNEQHWMPPVLWARSLGVKTAAYVDYYTFETLASFEWYDLLICNTQRHKRAFQWHTAVQYIPWGTDVVRFKPVPRSERPLTFLHSAGWDPERKGTEQVLRAWSRLPGETNLVIHSQADISPLLRDPAIEKRLVSRELVVLSGTMRPEELYQLGDVYVYPTHLEGIGLSVAEALASGLPVIVPDDGPMDEFVSDPYSVKVPVAERWHRRDGYYWPCNSVADSDVTQAMQSFASQSSGSVESWRRETRSVAMRRFNWHQNAADLASVISNAPIRVPNKNVTSLATPVHARFGRAVSFAGRFTSLILGERHVRQ